MNYDDTPPNDSDAERAVLGAMLLDRDAVGTAVEALRGADFYRPQHEEIFDLLVDLFAAGEPTDLVSVATAVQSRKVRLPDGPMYLHRLVEATPVAGNIEHWAKIVADKAHLRRLVDAGRATIQAAYSADDATKAQDAAEAALYDAAPRRIAEDYAKVGDLLPEVLDNVEAMGNGEAEAFRVTPTGFYDLDDLFGGGLQDGQMVVVAGRPASGKSTLAVDFARSAAISKALPTVVFSLEMTRQEIAMRLISAEAKVALAKLRIGALADHDWGRIAAVSSRITDAPLYLDDSPNLTMTEIRSKARRLHHEHGLRLVVIDYLQLMTSGKRVESRQVEVSEFSRQIKLLAKELGCPVVALSQLNRGVEQRSSKRPMLSDLRESGSIEQDADIVILVHRDDLYEQESTRPGEADLIVAKHRNGPTRDVVVAAQLHYARFVDLARE